MRAETDAGGDDLLLLMQFPAGEIGRKVALTVSPNVDDDDAATPGKFRAREFPVGTGMLCLNISSNSLLVTAFTFLYSHCKQ